MPLVQGLYRDKTLMRKRKYIKKLLRRLQYDMGNIITKSFEAEEKPITEGYVMSVRYKNAKFTTNPDSFCKE